MNSKSFLCVLAFMFITAFGFSQAVGDIAFLQYNADGSGTTVKFVALVDIPAGSTINFTDYGWLSGGGFRVNAGEGVDTWTSPVGGTSCGTVVSFTETNMILGTGGDQIIAFTGTVGSPTPIAAIQMNGAWDADATSNPTSAIPTGLTLGVNCIEIAPEIDNAMYDDTVNINDTKANLLAVINNNANWITSNTVIQNFTTTTFTVTDCGPSVTCPLSDYTITPLTGTVGTVITVVGPDLGAATTATINGVAATVTVINPTTIEIVVPAGAATSDLLITNEVSCVITQPYTILSTDSTTCDSSFSIPGGWTDLLITGVFDNTGGSCHYIELFNPTAVPITLTGVYELGISNNNPVGVNATPFNFNAGIQGITGTIAANSTFMIRFGSAGNTCNDCPTIIPDDTIESASFGVNGNSGGLFDRILLIKNGTNVDLWGNSNHAAAGYVYTRNTTTTAPNMTYSAADWTSVGTPDCFGFSIGGTAQTPTITSQPVAALSCDSGIALAVTATEGFVGGNPLAYQWYFSAPGDIGWTVVTDGGIYSGATTDTLTISDTSTVNNYQYYCQVRENDATCYTASDSVIIDVTTVTTTWNGTAWSNGTPDATKLVVLSGNYTTGGATPSFDACSLTIDAGFTLDITAGNYVNIVNNLTVNGTLEVRHEGSLVQQNDLGLVAGTGTTNVHKTTPTYVEYDYTYWSSPVQNETIGNVLAANPSNYIFYANTATFNDNDADSFDDEQDDWVVASGAFTPGIGLIAMGQGAFTTPLSSLPYQTYTQSVVFSDAVNNGVVTVNVAQDNSNTDSSINQNLIGNPYPSAIDPATFISTNPGLEGTLYFWAHRTFITNSLPGPDAYNFTNADYDSYNLAGGVASGAGGATPVGFKIASSQGFFANVTDASIDVIFNNAMRVTTGNNNFYRSQPVEKDRVWLNLTTPGNVFRQILVAFFDNTTAGYDRAYDGRRLEVGNDYDFYSLIGQDKYAIQSRETFDPIITVPLGFEVTQPDDVTISIATLEGVLNTADIYLEDKDLNIIHNLKSSDYTFNVGAAGDYKNRFVLRFNNGALSVDDEVISSDNLIVYEQENGIISVRTSKNKIVKSVKIYDMLGRTLINKQFNASTVGLPSTNYKSGTILIVKALLSDEEVLVSKFIKK